MTTACFTPETCARHEIAPGHPEQPARQAAIARGLTDSALAGRLEHCVSGPAIHEQLYRAHDEAYVQSLFDHSPAQGIYMLDGDTAMNPFSVAAALTACGAVVAATDSVLAGDFANAFCNVRPPGHHAERARAMGFCLFNNVAVAAMHALEQHGLERVAIVDFDVHHGNGTEQILTGDRRVLLCSTYQHPFYPNVNNPSIDGHIINVPLAAGTDGTAYRTAFSERVLPQLERFSPELVFVSAGFDGHLEDPLGLHELVEADYRWITRQVRNIAERHAGGRIVSTLEGGYDLPALARSAVAHVSALAE